MTLRRKLIGKKSRCMNSRKNNKTKGKKHCNIVKTTKIIKKRKQRTERRIIGGDTECKICGEEFQSDDKIITLKCGHGFHKDELIMWCNIKGVDNCTCPMDRSDISEEMTVYMSDPIRWWDNNRRMKNFYIIFFLQKTMSELITISSEPLSEMPPYIINANLPSGVAGGPKERIKNILVKLFANDIYFSTHLRNLKHCSNKNNNEEIKIDLISNVMERIDDTRIYADYELKVIIRDYLEDCNGGIYV
jgi:adenine-specific DNA methylase